jgi:hypothetical protein
MVVTDGSKDIPRFEFEPPNILHSNEIHFRLGKADFWKNLRLSEQKVNNICRCAVQEF